MFLGGLNLKEFLSTHEEWHALVSGWGDGVAFNKAEKIPRLEEIHKDSNSESDFYAILAREAWYYKIGMGIGRLTWGVVIVVSIFRIVG